jgi:leucyl-tRNA synthetase
VRHGERRHHDEQLPEPAEWNHQAEQEEQMIVAGENVLDAEAERLALASEKVTELLDGGAPKKVIVRAPKLVNVVV